MGDAELQSLLTLFRFKHRRVDIDLVTLAKPGENRLELLVYNTLSNHYTSIPTMFRGSTAAGLLGPVFVRIGQYAR